MPPASPLRKGPHCKQGFCGITFVNLQNPVKNYFILQVRLRRWWRFCAEIQECHFVIRGILVFNLSFQELTWIRSLAKVKLTDPVSREWCNAQSCKHPVNLLAAVILVWIQCQEPLTIFFYPSHPWYFGFCKSVLSQLTAWLLLHTQTAQLFCTHSWHLNPQHKSPGRRKNGEQSCCLLLDVLSLVKTPWKQVRTAFLFHGSDWCPQLGPESRAYRHYEQNHPALSVMHESWPQ